MRIGSVVQMKAKRQLLNQHLEGKLMGYIVRARLLAMACEGTKAAEWARVVEA